MSDTLSSSNLFKNERKHPESGRELTLNRRELPGEERETDEKEADG